MLNAAKLIQDFISGMNWEIFELDLMCQSAVIRQLEIIGEAARRISAETQATIPNIPYSKIIHQYVDLDTKVIWDTIQLALPELITILEQISG